MKRLPLFGLFALAMIIMIGCGGSNPPPPIEEPPPPVVTPDPEPEPEPEPPVEEPPAPQLQESQFRTVYFDFDKFNLRADARTALDVNYELMNEFPDVIVQIEGHCDERGTVEYNLSLGEKRARAAMDYLVERGIAGNRITVISYGKERPADPRSNEEAWSKNRRAEFRIISQ